MPYVIAGVGTSFLQFNDRKSHGFGVDIEAEDWKLAFTGGVQQYTLEFTWTGRTFSPSNANGGDESVILMGLDTRINGDVGAADDYPGTSGRVAANDGHFVTVTATIVQIVPEPSSFLLAGMASIGMGLVVWRRRKS